MTLFQRLALFCLLAIFAIYPSITRAYYVKRVDVKSTDGFSISPSKLDFKIKPGEQTVKQIQLTNESKSNLIFDISTEDVLGSVNPEEGMKFLGDKAGGDFSLKNWLTPETKVFVLEPNQQITFNVAINAPENALIGGHYAALLVSAKVAGASADLQTFSRLASIFLVTVGSDSLNSGTPGDLARIKSIELLRRNKQLLPSLKVTFENNNKIHISPNGKLSVYNMFGKKVAEKEIDNWYFLPESLREKEISIPDRFYFGRHKAVVDFFWQNPLTGLERKDSKSIVFWVMPPSTIALAIFAAAVLIVLMGWRRRKGTYYSLLAFWLIVGLLLPSAMMAMKSSNYQIVEDTIVVGGIEASSSTNYKLADTVGDIGGNASSSSYALKGGYRTPVTFSSLSISTPSSVTMTSCAQTVACTPSTSVNWTVTTNNTTGYTLSINAATTPALKAGSNSFADFSPSGTTGLWSVGASASAFGFAVGSAGQTDLVSVFKDDGSSCGSGSNVGSCYRGFNGTTPIQIISRSTAAASGNTTTVKFKAQIGSNYAQPVGNYSAAITATAAAL